QERHRFKAGTRPAGHLHPSPTINVAGAASGWDYSSRWLRDTGRLASIRTTQFIPIDLNAFLFKLESAIANISALKGEKETEALFRQKASARRDAVNRYL
ncbi:trehalase family glycosidase, partial [Pseudomonas aeruginosa]|uniref:trehalase family glycosidase n=1 Tax=Pseudomonas aeruginosa TaxID=287 RepID=UPI0031B73790